MRELFLEAVPFLTVPGLEVPHKIFNSISPWIELCTKSALSVLELLNNKLYTMVYTPIKLPDNRFTVHRDYVFSDTQIETIFTNLKFSSGIMNHDSAHSYPMPFDDYYCVSLIPSIPQYNNKLVADKREFLKSGIANEIIYNVHAIKSTYIAIIANNKSSNNGTINLLTTMLWTIMKKAYDGIVESLDQATCDKLIVLVI